MASLFPLRYFMIFLVIASLFGFMMSNMCITLALQAMTAKEVVINKTRLEVCPISDDVLKDSINEGKVAGMTPIGRTDRLRDKVYHWSQTIQSVIFGGVFITNAIFKTAAGVVVQRYGGKWILTVSLFGASLTSMVIPFAADHVWLIIVLRLIMGFFFSGSIPAAYDVIVKWIPLKERSICFSMLEVGQNLATITTSTSSGIIYKAWGWPALFYMPGSIGTAIATVVLMGLRSEPRAEYESEIEMNVISCKNMEIGTEEDPEAIFRADREQMKSVDTPFQKIVSNKAVLTATLFRFTTYFNQMLIASKIPAYLRDVQHEDISTNGYTNAGISAFGLFSLLFNGWLSGFLINRRVFKRTTVRKVFAFTAGFGIASCLFCVPLAGCNPSILNVILFLQAFFDGCSGNLQALPSEMTKFFPAVTYSLMATVAASGGFIAPSYAGLILDKVKNQWTAWCIIFWTTGSVIILTTINFIVNASAERQEFDFVEDRIPRKEKDGSLKSKV